MTPNETSVAEVYAAWFSARDDAYASFRGGQWICMKEPLTPAVIYAGFDGGPSVSSYTITPASTTHVACIDFDSDDGLALARAVRSGMAQRDAVGLLEVSRRGGHLWVVLDRLLPARTVRRAMAAFLRDAGVEVTPKVEIRPSHDEIKPEGFGAPIRMPTMPNPKTGLRYPMLDADDRPLSPRLDEMLLEIAITPALVMTEMAATMRPTIKDAKPDSRKPYTGPLTEGSASDILHTLWGVTDARPGHTVRCPAHSDKVPSLSILPDDQRACCKSPACVLNNNDRGRGTYELTVMAPTRGTA
jgi:hypothetical protein